jgi:hypothetical protein
VQKLKECDKQVIGCGVKASTSSLLVKSCDAFIYYDDLVKRAAAKPSRKRKAPESSAEERQLEGVEQVMEVVRSLAQDYENVWSSMVKQTLMRVNPGFNHEYHGYRSWNAMLKDLQIRGMLELDHDRQKGNIMVHLKE